MSNDQHLRAEIEKLTVENVRQALVIQKLQHYLRGLLRGRYGRATEKLLGDTPADQIFITEIETFLKEERRWPLPLPQPPPRLPQQRSRRLSLPPPWFPLRPSAVVVSARA